MCFYLYYLRVLNIFKICKKDSCKCWIRYGYLFELKINEIEVFKFVLFFWYLDVIWIFILFCMYKGIFVLLFDIGIILLVFDVVLFEFIKYNIILFNNGKFFDNII